MADEGDSKSLVLITRVGSTPTTGIESSSKSKGFGLLFFFIPPHPARLHTFVSTRKLLAMDLECYKRRTEKRASELSADPKDTEGSGAFWLCKKEMLSWSACSNSSNRAQEKNAASG